MFLQFVLYCGRFWHRLQKTTVYTEAMECSTRGLSSVPSIRLITQSDSFINYGPNLDTSPTSQPIDNL